MCLSDVARVIEHDPATYDAVVDVDGRSISVSTITLGIDHAALSPGDWLVVNAGLAVERLTAGEARTVLRARADLALPPTEERP